MGLCKLTTPAMPSSAEVRGCRCMFDHRWRPTRPPASSSSPSSPKQPVNDINSKPGETVLFRLRTRRGDVAAAERLKDGGEVRYRSRSGDDRLCEEGSRRPHHQRRSRRHGRTRTEPQRPQLSRCPHAWCSSCPSQQSESSHHWPQAQQRIGVTTFGPRDELWRPWRRSSSRRRNPSCGR